MSPRLWLPAGGASLPTEADGKVLSGVSGAWAAAFPPGFEIVKGTKTTNTTAIAGTSFGTGTTALTLGATVFDGSACYVELSFAQAGNSTVDSGMIFELSDGGVNAGILLQATNASATLGDGRMVKVPITPSAGSHTYSLVVWVSAGTGFVNASDGLGANIAPLLMRFVKA